MNKKEFLESLRRNLSSEIPASEIDSNIRFYEEYLSSNSKEEEIAKVAEVGDPRLIAMNIIETYKMSHKIPHNAGNNTHSSQYEEVYESGKEYQGTKQQTHISAFKMKLMGAISIVLLVVFLILIMKALSSALRLFLPIILVFFVVIIFAGLFRR